MKVIVVTNHNGVVVDVFSEGAMEEAKAHYECVRAELFFSEVEVSTLAVKEPEQFLILYNEPAGIAVAEIYAPTYIDAVALAHLQLGYKVVSVRRPPSPT